MPAKGRYFLNEGDEGPDQAALYEKYRLTSLHGPLLLLLLLVAAATCIALISIAFSHEDLRRHQVVLGTAFLMLTLFVALYVLVYVECLVQRWLRALALLTWACLMVLGSVLMWDSLENEAHAWEQVPFFLFVVFVVYALLPLSRRAAIVVGVTSTVSHLLVFGAVTRAFQTSMSSTQLGLQLLANAVILLGGNFTGAFHKHQLQDASRDLFIYTVKCIQIRRKLRVEKRQQENLLLSVLPAHISMGMKLAIIERLKEGGDRHYMPDNNFHSLLDCLWKKKFKKEHEEFETMENVNRLLLENVLPAHVAAHFIGDKAAEDWYHQSYDCVCVMFASVPDFKVFYTECDVNKEGLECLRLLNEIIADFDESFQNRSD